MKIAQKNAVFCTFFLNFIPQSVSKCMQNAFISRVFSPVFCTHLPKWNLFRKTLFFCTFFFLTCYHKVSQDACKMHSLQNGFCTCFGSICESENCWQKGIFLQVFFRLVSAKCFKTHAKCIHFKTVSARVLHAFTKMKIALKNTVFSRLFQTCFHKVSQI